MIASLNGILEEKGLDDAIIDVNGVGYRVALSLRSLTRLPQTGQRVKLRVQTVVREDAFDLYGFLTAVEEELFKLLTSVSHVGPKVAMNVLSGMDADELVQAIARGDVAALTRLHGVGKKTAERLVVELKDKMKTLAIGAAAAEGRSGDRPLPGDQRNDLVSALVNLGYKPAQAEKAAEMAEEKAGTEAALDTLIREALRFARG